jgi:hypothetical protein
MSTIIAGINTWDKANEYFRAAIEAIRRESGGGRRGVDRLTGYEFEPVDDPDPSQPARGGRRRDGASAAAR